MIAEFPVLGKVFIATETSDDTERNTSRSIQGNRTSNEREGGIILLKFALFAVVRLAGQKGLVTWCLRAPLPSVSPLPHSRTLRWVIVPSLPLSRCLWQNLSTATSRAQRLVPCLRVPSIDPQMTLISGMSRSLLKLLMVSLVKT